MPQLIKKINASLSQNVNGGVVLIKSLTAEMQQEDYVNINGFIAYLQDLTKTEYTSALQNPSFFGLKNKYNIPVITLNIDY